MYPLHQSPQDYFPQDVFNCHFELNTQSPLIVSPRPEREGMDFINWAQSNQRMIARAIQQFGAIVFSGFELVKDNFSAAFTAITGIPPQDYKGDTPRDAVGHKVYKSTAVANAHEIPLHQEVTYTEREKMPKYISFFCVTPPKEGTGKTLVGNVERITEKIQTLMPNLWAQMSSKTLKYTVRYLPKDSWRTKWIRWLNPSHATIEKRFGTENRAEVEARCRQEGLTCEWDGEWAVISRKGIPATINRNGKVLFCNSIHLDRLNPKLCGGWFNYILARILLYPTSRSTQFDVQFDDGTQISRRDAGKLLSIIQEHREGRSWKRGDLMVLDNATTMHAKTSHVGQREILVAMSGSVLTDSE